MVTLAPSLASLDPFHAASAALVNKTIMLRVRGFGWCGGKLIETVPKRNRKIDGVQVNFRAKFDVDEFPCDLL